MRIGELGEFGVIKRIARSLAGGDDSVIVGIGDDVAVLRGSGDHYLLATCDIQVENVHFVRTTTTPYQLGRKAIAINLSDIAAMGGQPSWALVSLALPQDTLVKFVDELYRGMTDQLNSAGASLVGGNLSNIEHTMVIDIFLLGQVQTGQFLCRRGAREGDLILVTGTLGDSRAGLELLHAPELAVSKLAREQVSSAHLTPQPRLIEGRVLAGTGLVHAMLDVSDGTLGDLRHICEASTVGAEIWPMDLPISSATREVAAAAAVGENEVDWALTGGEDYELLFTAAPADSSRLQQELEERSGTSARVIGRILPAAEGIRLRYADGRIQSHEAPAGWDHFQERK
jgi:thiamine-monophosphate kinase